MVVFQNQVPRKAYLSVTVRLIKMSDARVSLREGHVNLRRAQIIQVESFAQGCRQSLGSLAAPDRRQDTQKHVSTGRAIRFSHLQGLWSYKRRTATGTLAFRCRFSSFIHKDGGGGGGGMESRVLWQCNSTSMFLTVRSPLASHFWIFWYHSVGNV